MPAFNCAASALSHPAPALLCGAPLSPPSCPSLQHKQESSLQTLVVRPPTLTRLVIWRLLPGAICLSFLGDHLPPSQPLHFPSLDLREKERSSLAPQALGHVCPGLSDGGSLRGSQRQWGRLEWPPCAHRCPRLSAVDSGAHTRGSCLIWFPFLLLPFQAKCSSFLQGSTH